MTTYAETKKGPLAVRATRISEPNAFSVPKLVALTASGWQLADNGDADTKAEGVVVAAEAAEFWVVTSRGQVVEIPRHGFGLRADILWLGTAGNGTATQPAGAGIRVVQVVLKVVDSDNIILFPETPFTI